MCLIKIYFGRKLLLEKIRCLKKLGDIEESYKENFVLTSSNIQHRYLIFEKTMYNLNIKTIFSKQLALENLACQVVLIS